MTKLRGRNRARPLPLAHCRGGELTCGETAGVTPGTMAGVVVGGGMTGARATGLAREPPAAADGGMD